MNIEAFRADFSTMNRGPQVPRSSFGITENGSAKIVSEVNALAARQDSLDMNEMEASCNRLYDMVEELQVITKTYAINLCSIVFTHRRFMMDRMFAIVIDEMQLQNRDQNAMFMQLLSAVEERVSANINSVKDEIVEFMATAAERRHSVAPRQQRTGRMTQTSRSSLEPRRSFEVQSRNNRNGRSLHGGGSAMNIFPIIETDPTSPQH